MGTVEGMHFGMTSSTLAGAINLTARAGNVDCDAVSVINDTMLVMTCAVAPGEQSIRVAIDGQGSAANPVVTVLALNDAGIISFTTATATVSELTDVLVLNVSRRAPFAASPVDVVIATRDGTATAPDYYVSLNETIRFTQAEETKLITINITAAARAQQGPRKGAADDGGFEVYIAALTPQQGRAEVGQHGSMIVSVQAACEAVTDTCAALWTGSAFEYRRIDVSN